MIGSNEAELKSYFVIIMIIIINNYMYRSSPTEEYPSDLDWRSNKEEESYVLFDLHWIPDSSHCSFYIRSSSPSWNRNQCTPNLKHRNCTEHYHLLLGFVMDVLLFWITRRRVGIQNNTSNEEYAFFDLNWILDSAHFPLYMPSSSLPRIQNGHSLIPKIERRVCFLWYEPNSRWSLLFPLYAIMAPPRIRNEHLPNSKYRKKRKDPKHRNTRMFPLILIKVLMMLIFPLYTPFFSSPISLD